MPSARTIKARNGKYKSNAESIRSRKRDNYQNNPQIKRMPRERVTRLTLTKQRKSLVSNIIIIQSATGEPLVSNIGLIQSAKGESLVSNIGLTQSPKREPLVSNIIIILAETRLPHVYAGLSTVIVYVLKNELSMH